MSKSTRRSTRKATAKKPRALDESRPAAGRAPRWAREDKLLDEALEQTFPASDPLSSLRPTR
jgi:hypothetical protein